MCNKAVGGMTAGCVGTHGDGLNSRVATGGYGSVQVCDGIDNDKIMVVWRNDGEDRTRGGGTDRRLSFVHD